MNTKKTAEGVDGRPRMVRAGTWLAGQVLFKDGGLLASLRGLLAAGMLALAAKFFPRNSHGANRALLIVGVTALGLSIVLAVIIALVYVRMRSRGAVPDQGVTGREAGATADGSSRSEVLLDRPSADLTPELVPVSRSIDVNVQVRVGFSWRPRPVPPTEAGDETPINRSNSRVA